MTDKELKKENELSKEELLLALAIAFKDFDKTPQRDLFNRAYRQIDSLVRRVG